MADDLDAEAREELQQEFNLVAKGGVLNLNQLGEVMRNMGQIMSATELNELCSAAGTSPQAVDFNGFLTMMAKKVASNDSKDDIILAFSVFDKDGAGYVAASELRHVMTNLGSRLPEAQVAEMLAEADSHADGRVNYQSFVEQMLAKGDHL
ncbi:calmodulin [Thecamonas trahens ATCC 50062]|uniref:Calmodulin n=1 Tax=Thecamonas trahens ATCC 50062 TaxID=461836 RepID=A0A0L0D2A1_THETB|nr:calmodulin [Thecamonas trahens ATCC 50062]KNC46260.1 calmodulin [Thecamonas trahens ATCC 50062]|eukprot:XP_013760554.1 calmodulin [Thecamonas trahens ATCC 50062]